MGELTFNNVENKPYIVNIDKGKKKMIWDSRSVAVHGILAIRVKGINYVLLTVRSKACLEMSSKYANVTGFIDWNEDAIGALKREYWEETKIDFDKYFNEENLLKGSIRTPYYVQTDPGENNQVIVLRYRFLFELDDFPDFGLSDEVQEVRFSPFDEALEMIGNENYEFAWNHAEILKMSILEFES